MPIICKKCGVPVEKIYAGTICLKCKNQYSNNWKKQNVERVLSYRIKEYALNKDAVLARIARWQAKNPERWNAIRKADSHNRRVKTKYNCIPIPKSELIGLAMVNDNCFYCNEPHGGKYNFDHYIPLARGGKHEIENIRISCVSCNKHKAAKFPEEFFKVIVLYKSSLIDSKPRQGNEAEGMSHRERLNEMTPSGMQQSDLAA